MNLNCPKKAYYCLRGQTIFSDHVSHSLTVIFTLSQVKHKQLSREPYTLITINSIEHHTKCNFHGAVLNKTDCVWIVNAKTEQFNLHLVGIDALFCLRTCFMRFLGSLNSEEECLNETGLKF